MVGRDLLASKVLIESLIVSAYVEGGFIIYELLPLLEPDEVEIQPRMEGP